MSVASMIQSLIEEAAPLRLLAEDDPRRASLGAIVDSINDLRAVQATPGFVDSAAAPMPVKPARASKKARLEGADS
jgi:hypothetical protein